MGSIIAITLHEKVVGYLDKTVKERRAEGKRTNRSSLIEEILREKIKAEGVDL